MTVVDVTERLMGEFEDRLGLAVIAKVVSGCRHDLEGSAAGALPELVERLARQRLQDLLASAAELPEAVLPTVPPAAVPEPRSVPREVRLP